MAKAARKRASGRAKGSVKVPPARAKAIRHVRWLRARLVRLRAALARRSAALGRLRRRFGGSRPETAEESRPGADADTRADASTLPTKGEATKGEAAKVDATRGDATRGDATRGDATKVDAARTKTRSDPADARADAAAKADAAPKGARPIDARRGDPKGAPIDAAAPTAPDTDLPDAEECAADPADEAGSPAAGPDRPAVRRGLADLRRPWATPVRPPVRSIARLAGAGARRLAAALAHAVIQGIALVGRWLVDHRVGLLALAHRALWWSALGLFVIGARGVIEPTGGALHEVLPAFVVGFSLCAAAILIADTRRIRWAALALGFGHGALGLLVWSVLSGS